jgi:hypothetical protein
VLSTSNGAFQPAYGTTAGWDFATGIGTINAANLVNSWPAGIPNFTLSPSSPSLTITQGTTGGVTITVAQQNGFNSPVNLSVSGVPNGVTPSFNPTSTTNTSTLTLTAAATATIGTATITITGTFGNLTHQTTVSLTVNPEGGFDLSASAGSLTIPQGSQGASTIQVNGVNGFNGTVSLSLSAVPSGVTASLNPVSTTGTSTLTFTVSSTAPTGTFNPTVTGICGNLSGAITVPVTISAGPSFTLSASPTSLSVARGAKGTVTVSFNPVRGFAGSVKLSPSGLPSRITASFSPNPTTSTSTLTLTVGSRALTGTFTIAVRGISGTLLKQTTFRLTVH